MTQAKPPQTLLAHLQAHFQEIQESVAHFIDPNAQSKVSRAQDWPEPVAHWGQAFGLSPFEQRILIMCAAQDLSPEFAQLLESFSPPLVTFSLAMAVLPEPHWSACTIQSPLRQYDLIHLNPGHNLVNRGMKLDERLLVSLLGISSSHKLFSPYFSHVPPPAPETYQQGPAQDIARAWASASHPPPAVLLTGGEPGDRERVASAAAATLGRSLFTTTLDSLPPDHAAFDALMRHLAREHRLAPIAIFLEDNDGDPNQELLAKRILGQRDWFVILGQDRKLDWRGSRPTLHVPMPEPTHSQKVQLWLSVGGDLVAPDQADRLANHFNLGRCTVETICNQARAQTEQASETNSLWTLTKRQIRPNLENLAQCIEPRTTMARLVLPEAKKLVLNQIAGRARHRYVVNEKWGFGKSTQRGLGISALFHGISGTGKTLAAEAIANDLGLDLYHIDLSTIISKYIGETEKNLSRIFDTAERGGAVLFFDEADALFGKRSKVQDSHDRYANIQVSYLLQRLESYRGLAILATNDKSALDTAFTRRLQFILEFPFPDTFERMQIWHLMFSNEAPTLNLDMEKLAQLRVTGGHIHNIALQSAYFAASENEPIQMHHILQAARATYGRIGKRITPKEIGNWLEPDGHTAPEAQP